MVYYSSSSASESSIVCDAWALVLMQITVRSRSPGRGLENLLENYESLTRLACLRCATIPKLGSDALSRTFGALKVLKFTDQSTNYTWIRKWFPLAFGSSSSDHYYFFPRLPWSPLHVHQSQTNQSIALIVIYSIILVMNVSQHACPADIK